LDPEDIKILSLEVIRIFGKGTGLSGADIRLLGTKDPSIRPRCIRTVRAQTQCKSINQSITTAQPFYIHISVSCFFSVPNLCNTVFTECTTCCHTKSSTFCPHKAFTCFTQ